MLREIQNRFAQHLRPDANDLGQDQRYGFALDFELGRQPVNLGHGRRSTKRRNDRVIDPNDMVALQGNYKWRMAATGCL